LKEPHKAIAFHVGFTVGLFRTVKLAYVNEYVHLTRDMEPSCAIFKGASIKSVP